MSFRDLDTLVDAHQSVTTKVFHDGELVYQNLSNRVDRPWRVYSVTKSVVSLLVGIAQEEGLLSLDDKVSAYIPQWDQGSSADVTVRHLLSMTSGREWSASLDDEMVSIAADQSAFALELGQSDPPGTVWRYDNVAAQILEPVLSKVTGGISAYAEQKLFGPLGIGELSWQRDEAGNPLTYAGLTATAEQLGILGHFMMNHGAVNGEQIVPADYIAQATNPGSSLNSAYGLMWWSNAAGQFLDGGVAVGRSFDTEARSGQLAPDVPSDAFWALGWGGQILAVVPSKKIVAIRLGRRPRYPDDFTVEKFTSTVLNCFS